jgi:uncharacterized protein DUF4345
MNVRLTVASLGAIMLVFGFVAILRPLLVLGMLGFVVVDASHTAFCLGETRATYGGVFAAMGVVTLWAAIDPYRYRDRTLAIGLLWLGACAARLFGTSVDGSPGPLGWVSAGFEGTVGLLLTVASWLATPKEPAQTGPMQP